MEGTRMIPYIQNVIGVIFANGNPGLSTVSDRLGISGTPGVMLVAHTL